MRDQASEWVMRTLDRRVAARKRQSTTRPRKLSDRARSGAVWQRVGAAAQMPVGDRSWAVACRYARSVRRIPTAPVAAGTLIAGYAIAASSGSRLLGGFVLLFGGLWCIQAWTRRHGTRTAATLAAVGLGAFVLTHLLALAIGAWPSVLLVAAAMAAAAWSRADARPTRSHRPRLGHQL